jgi:hypothetical protein
MILEYRHWQQILDFCERRAEKQVEMSENNSETFSGGIH